MTFQTLFEFVTRHMRMSHVYQPVMLMELLCSGGAASTSKIAKAILGRDDSQIEYYEKITRDMVGRVLRNRGVVSKQGKEFVLNGFESLSPDEVKQLIAACQLRLDEYLANRGERVWQHRKLSAGYISGTLRYDVLKRAEFHCELCGISADLKALEVDHILPRNHGGSDDLENLQALCYSCNAMKRDRDDTDFRAIRESYKARTSGCLFCEIPEKRIVLENELAYAVHDGFPVTPLHSLVIPKRHVVDYFGLSRPEVNACDSLIKTMRGQIQELDGTVSAFNIGMNAGEDAGQSVFHCHIHLIPRRSGDVERPRGGVRNTIPGKGNY
jgi:diadenosine tetraphosphate (Ap4A) HIT family hydrolase/5-methylcytosine-specific restriction endonuclease McrA